MNRPKMKGTRHESSIIAVLRANGWPHAERRTSTGSADKGDIGGIVGVVIEAKAEVRYDIPGWLRELDKEIVNAHAATGAVWAKLKGKAGAEDGFILMRPAAFMAILKDAGYGGGA